MSDNEKNDRLTMISAVAFGALTGFATGYLSGWLICCLFQAAFNENKREATLIAIMLVLTAALIAFEMLRQKREQHRCNELNRELQEQFPDKSKPPPITWEIK